MTASTVLIPGTIAQSAGGVSWINLNNAKVEDGSYAECGLIGPGGGGGTPNQLKATNLGYGLPSTAVIEGIKLEIKVSSAGGASAGDANNNGVYLLYNGGNTTYADTPNKGQTWPNTGLTWLTYGSSSSLWGRTWTPAEINHINFGASLSATIASGTSNIRIDAIKITVYYHIGGSTTPADVSTREIYKVYNQRGQYIGCLPTPTAPFPLAQDINSLGSQVTVKVPVSADISGLPSENYTTEDLSANYTGEDGSTIYTTEGVAPIVSLGLQGIDTLIKNGNTVKVWLYNYFYPNGKCMFIGKIRNWEAEFSGGDCVDVILYSTGYDMDNYITRGAPFTYTNDQSQTSQNASDTISSYSGLGSSWNYDGQQFTVGAGVTNLGAINLLLNGTADVTVELYSNLGLTLIGSTTQSVNVATATEVQFGFPIPITVTPGAQYFFAVKVGSGQSITIYYQNTDIYSGGGKYSNTYGGGSGGGSWLAATGDLYFITASGTGSTSATYTAKDPSTGMLAPIITDYNLRGGSQVWTAASIDATGLSLTYTFNVQTIYEALQAILSLAPNGFYYYVDLGTQTIYFKNQSVTADYKLVKGIHINALKLGVTTERSINTLLFTGDEVSPGVNLYKQYSDNASNAAFGPLLDRKTDGRVSLDATANAIGTSEIAERSGEQYQTTVTIPHTTSLDITLLVPGKVIGFRGYGSFVDRILAQIVRREWTAQAVTLTLGILPARLSTEFSQTTRELIATQTQNNPSAPS